MEQQKMFKQMMEFQKSTFDNSFNALSNLQEQAESMVEMFTNQAPWLPEEGKKVIKDWIKTYQKGRDDFKKAVDANYKKVEEFFAAFETKKSK
jgi:polyhydroxyalkanoate synthesis regulator phasin